MIKFFLCNDFKCICRFFSIFDTWKHAKYLVSLKSSIHSNETKTTKGRHNMIFHASLHSLHIKDKRLQTFRRSISVCSITGVWQHIYYVASEIINFASMCRDMRCSSPAFSYYKRRLNMWFTDFNSQSRFCRVPTWISNRYLYNIYNTFLGNNYNTNQSILTVKTKTPINLHPSSLVYGSLESTPAIWTFKLIVERL